MILGEMQARSLGSARPNGQIIETLGGAAGQQEAQEIPDDNQKKMREDPDPKLIRQTVSEVRKVWIALSTYLLIAIIRKRLYLELPLSSPHPVVKKTQTATRNTVPTVAIKADRLPTRAVMNPKTKRLNRPALTTG